jgi:hypothetical protein
MGRDGDGDGGGESCGCRGRMVGTMLFSKEVPKSWVIVAAFLSCFVTKTKTHVRNLVAGLRRLGRAYLL